MSYATDGKCHNLVTDFLECGKPATIIGVRRDRMFRMGFCDDCRKHGREASLFDLWLPLEPEFGDNQ